MRLAALTFALCLPLAATAQTRQDVIRDLVENHILPRFQTLADAGADLQAAAETDCDPASPELRAAFGATFDAWMGAGHLRFGPTETDSRGFALAFWPDTRGRTPGTLNGLIGEADPVVDDPAGFATVSVAARGLYALELLLFDPSLGETGDPGYRCRLTQAIATDIARTSAAILADWRDNHADALLMPGRKSTYRDFDEALRALYTALTTGFQFTSDVRLGRPLGTFDRPRPTRAEARRSGRSLRHVVLSLRALGDLARGLAALAPEGAAGIDAGFARALTAAERIGSPDFSGVAEPQGRIRVEALQQAIDDVRLEVGQVIAPSLGIAAGFNSMDGD